MNDFELHIEKRANEKLALALEDVFDFAPEGSREQVQANLDQIAAAAKEHGHRSNASLDFANDAASLNKAPMLSGEYGDILRDTLEGSQKSLYNLKDDLGSFIRDVPGAINMGLTGELPSDIQRSFADSEANARHLQDYGRMMDHVRKDKSDAMYSDLKGALDSGTATGSKALAAGGNLMDFISKSLAKRDANAQSDAYNKVVHELPDKAMNYASGAKELYSPKLKELADFVDQGMKDKRIRETAAVDLTPREIARLTSLRAGDAASSLKDILGIGIEGAKAAPDNLKGGLEELGRIAKPGVDKVKQTASDTADSFSDAAKSISNKADEVSNTTLRDLLSRGSGTTPKHHRNSKMD